jgi:hypothetical protein
MTVISTINAQDKSWTPICAQAQVSAGANAIVTIYGLLFLKFLNMDIFITITSVINGERAVPASNQMQQHLIYHHCTVRE